jgi:hypothetical protein
MKRLTGVLFGLLCIAWIVVLPFSILLAAASFADRGGGLGVSILKADFLSLPVVCLLAPVAAWIGWKKGRRRVAWGLAAAPVLWLAAPAVVWAAMR